MKPPCEDCLLLPICKQKFKTNKEIYKLKPVLFPLIDATYSIVISCELIKSYLNTNNVYELSNKFQIQQGKYPLDLKKFLEVMNT